MRLKLAQFDLVKPRFSRLDIRISEFYASTAYINELAEQHPGFIWRETLESQELLDSLFGEGYLYTLSLWRSVESLKDFLYETPHKKFMRRGREWFLPLSHPREVLWWVEEEHTPTLEEAHERLERLCKVGPSYYAFNLAHSDIPVVVY